MAFPRIIAYQRTVFTAAQPYPKSEQDSRLPYHFKDNELPENSYSKLLDTCQSKENTIGGVEISMKTKDDKSLSSASVSEKNTPNWKRRRSCSNSESLSTQEPLRKIQGKKYQSISVDNSNSRIPTSSVQDESHLQKLMACFKYPQMPELYIQKLDDEQNNSKLCQNKPIQKNYSGGQEKIVFVKVNNKHSSMQNHNLKHLQLIQNEQNSKTRDRSLLTTSFHSQMSQQSHRQQKNNLMQNDQSQQNNHEGPSYNQMPSLQQSKDQAHEENYQMPQLMSQQEPETQQYDWTQKQTSESKPFHKLDLHCTPSRNQIPPVIEPQNKQELNLTKNNKQEEELNKQILSSINLTENQQEQQFFQQMPLPQPSQNQQYVQSSLNRAQSLQNSNSVEPKAQEQNFSVPSPHQMIALSKQVANVHHNPPIQNVNQFQPITRQPQTQEQISQNVNPIQQMPPPLLPLNQLHLYQQNSSHQLGNPPPPPPLQPPTMPFPYLGQPQSTLPYGYMQPYNPQLVFPFPSIYYPSSQPVFMPQPQFEPPQMLVSNATSTDGSLIGVQRLNQVEPLYQLTQMSRGTQKTVMSPKPALVQLHINEPKIINIFPSMSSQNSITDESTIDESTKNNLLSLGESMIKQMSQMDKPKINTENIESNEAPTCSKYLSPEETNDLTEPEPSDPSSENDGEENEKLSILKLRISRCDGPQTISPVIKLADVKLDEKATQNRLKMQALTKDVASKVLYPVLWTTSGLNHPLRTSPSEDRQGEKREKKSQKSETVPKKRKHRKRK